MDPEKEKLIIIFHVTNSEYEYKSKFYVILRHNKCNLHHIFNYSFIQDSLVLLFDLKQILKLISD